MNPEIARGVEERNRILIDMDVEAAKAFIRDTGGTVPKRALDWKRVLHLARLEVQDIDQSFIDVSRVYLAMTGAQSIMMLPRGSVYFRCAMSLLLPDPWVDEMLESYEGARHFVKEISHVP
jgi:hypothetical protein